MREKMHDRDLAAIMAVIIFVGSRELEGRLGDRMEKSIEQAERMLRTVDDGYTSEHEDDIPDGLEGPEAS